MDMRTVRTQDSLDKDIFLLRTIDAFTSENGYPPSIRDLLEPLETTSTSVVEYRIRLLLHKDWITKEPFIARSIVITEQGREALS